MIEGNEKEHIFLVVGLAFACNSLYAEPMTGIQWNELRKGRTGLAARYQAVGIPHYVLISPEGKVIAIWSGYGPGSLKAKLKEMIP